MSNENNDGSDDSITSHLLNAFAYAFLGGDEGASKNKKADHSAAGRPIFRRTLKGDGCCTAKRADLPAVRRK